MLTVEQVKNNISNYKIVNNIVIDKKTNQPIHDENKILEVKSSVLIYKEAKLLYEKRLRGSSEDYNFYINKALKIYGLNGEINDYPQNKLIREIIEKNGLVQINYGGNNLSESEKFSFLCAPKKDYGLAVIKYLAHQKGIDISNLNVAIDLSDFQKIGVSKVSIKYDKSIYSTKKSLTRNERLKEHLQGRQSLYQHPMAKELNELEHQKQIAKKNNDEDAYNYAQNNISRIIRNNPATVDSEKWNSLSIQEQMDFDKLKINESKILHDKDSFDYWKSNLTYLEEKAQDLPKNTLKTENKTDFNIKINQLKDQTLQISAEYKQMLSDSYIDDSELSILISELKDLSNYASTLKSTATSKSQEIILDSTIEIIKQELDKMINLQKTNHNFEK